MIGLQQELCAQPFGNAKSEVYRAVGRPEGNPKERMTAEYSYTNAEGKLLSQVIRYEGGPKGKRFSQRRPSSNGASGWIWNTKGIQPVLYNLPKVIGAETVFVVEGEKDVGTLDPWGFVATCNAGGAGKWKTEHAQQLAHKHVIIIPDNDPPGEAHARQVAKSLQGIAASVRILRLPDLPEKGDVTDWKEGGGTPEALRALIEQTAIAAVTPEVTTDKPVPPSQPTNLPPGFILDEEGLKRRKIDSDEAAWVSGPLHVVAFARTAENDDWGKLLRFQDPEGVSHDWLMPLSMLAKDTSEFRAKLLSMGLQISAAKSAPEDLRQYLQMTRPPLFARTVNRIGWFNESFVLPDVNIGPEGAEMVLLQPGREMTHLLRAAGTLDEWRQNVSIYCSGNSRLLFAVSCAAATPLLHFFREQSGGFHLVAETTVGKTTCLLAAGSFWGGGGQNGFVQSWLTTANGLENTAESHNNVLLLLDELRLIDPEHASKVAYSLSNGQSKSRMDRNTRAHRRTEWQLLFLSTGELGLSSHIEAARNRTYGGQEVRFCEIPARVDDQNGAFELLHGFGSPKAFAEHLRTFSRMYYGTACRSFLRHLVRAGFDEVRDMAQQYRRRFMQRYVPPGEVPEIARGGDRFSLVAAGGEMATAMGITGWDPGEASAAAGLCFQAWVRQRGTGGHWDEEQAIRCIRSFITAHGNSRFQFYTRRGQGSDDNAKVINRVGFRCALPDGGSEYQIPVDAFPEVCGPFSVDLVKRSLQKRGYLVLEDDEHLSCARKLPELGRKRCYVISTKIFEDPGDVAKTAGAAGESGEGRVGK